MFFGGTASYKTQEAEDNLNHFYSALNKIYSLIAAEQELAVKLFDVFEEGT